MAKMGFGGSEGWDCSAGDQAEIRRLRAEVRNLQARLDAMKLAGTRFSNWAYNVSQQPELAEGQGESLLNMVRDWDVAVRGEDSR